MDTDNLPHMDKVLNFIKINESLESFGIYFNRLQHFVHMGEIVSVHLS